MPSAPLTITLNLNGQPRSLAVDPKQPALSALREALGQCSLPTGCAPQGICGSCVALVNGRPRLTCTLRSASLSGKTIETQDSFSAEEQDAVTRAFAAIGMDRCGYSTPGIALQAVHLLRSNPVPSAAHIDRALALHTFGRTSWPRVREAVTHTGRLLRGAPPEPPTAPVHPTTAAAVLGRRTRIEDMLRPGMVHVAPCFAPHPRCRITEISAPDGATVLTAADLPAGHTVSERPLLVAVGDETRCTADVVALAIGDTLAAAQASAAAVQVSATSLAPVRYADIGDIIDEHHIMQGEPPPFAAVAHAVFAEAAVAAATPAFLQPAAALAIPLAAGQLSVYSHAPDPIAERALLAAWLGCPARDLRVETVASDGSASAPASAQVTGWAALAAQRLQRPARVALTHADSVRLRPGRPAARVSVSVQADADGNLLSVDGELLVDGGGYGERAAALSRRAALLMAGPYQTPHLDVRARCAQTHNPPAGESPGLGCLPGVLALERCMDLLAEATGLDPVTVRARNLASDAHRAVLEAAAGVHREALAAGRTAGLACAAQAIGQGGTEQGRAVLEPRPGGEVLIHTGASELDQEDAVIQVAAEVTGLPVGRLVVTASTDHPIAGDSQWLRLDAVRAAAAAMVAGEDGPDAAYVGEASLELEADTFAALGFAAEVAILDASGALEEVVVVTAANRGARPLSQQLRLEGAVLQGLGAALSEGRCSDESGTVDHRYRSLGLFPARGVPTIRAIVLAADGPQPIEGAAMLATAPAIVAAIRARGEDPGEDVPMSASSPARAAGITPRQGLT